MNCPTTTALENNTEDLQHAENVVKAFRHDLKDFIELQLNVGQFEKFFT